MSDLASIRADIADAQARLTELATRAEIASDRGGRGPSPKEVADAEWGLEHHQRRLDLARQAAPVKPAPAVGGIR